MEKSIFSNDYGIFLAALKEARLKADMTQQQAAKALGQTQSFISKCERGERRVDVVELRRFCSVYGMKLDEFITDLLSRFE